MTSGGLGHHSVSSGLNIPQLTYNRLSQLRSSPLLPSLQALHWSVGSSLPPILFLSPCLELVGMTNIHPNGESLITLFLSSLAYEAPGLQHLILPGDLFQNVMQLIPDFHNLRSLEIYVSTARESHEPQSNLQSLTFAGFNALPHLENFVADLGSIPFSTNSGFSVLKNIQITGEPHVLISMLKRLETPHMESVSLFSWPPTVSAQGSYGYGVGRGIRGGGRDEEEVPALQHTLSDCFEHICLRWSNSMRALTIDYAGPDAFTFDVLAPLSRLPNLHTLRLRMSLALSIEDITRLTQASPKLVSLELPLGSSLDIAALDSLTINCPNLRYLQVGINAHTLPPPEVEGHSSFSPGHRLETLYTVSARGFGTDDAALVAQYLDRLFPCLKVVWIDSDHMPTKWREVAIMLRICREVRLDTIERVKGLMAATHAQGSGRRSCTCCASVDSMVYTRDKLRIMQTFTEL